MIGGINDTENNQNSHETSDEKIGALIRRATQDVRPNMMLLWHSLQHASSPRLSPFVPSPEKESDKISYKNLGRMVSSRVASRVSSWVSVWKISLPAAAILVIIALGAWQDRASLLLLSQDLTGQPITTEKNSSGQNVASPAGVATQAVSPGDSNADLNQDLSLVNSKLDNINSYSSALDQSLGGNNQ